MAKIKLTRLSRIAIPVLLMSLFLGGLLKLFEYDQRSRQREVTFKVKGLAPSVGEGYNRTVVYTTEGQFYYSNFFSRVPTPEIGAEYSAVVRRDPFSPNGPKIIWLEKE